MLAHGKTAIPAASGGTSGRLSAFDIAKLRESLQLAEITLAASALNKDDANNRRTAPGAVGDFGPDNKTDGADRACPREFVPPSKQALLFLVRMGSFTSAPQHQGGDTQDDDLSFPAESSREALLARCRKELAALPAPLPRSFQSLNNTGSPASYLSSPITRPLKDDLTGSNEDDINKSNNCVMLNSEGYPPIRIFQWNHLSQTLGTKNDKFVECPSEALDWLNRRWRLLEEILTHDPDIICLQEVDHFNLLRRALASIGYEGHFTAKPDSPCIYLPENNGPDGCAIFYRTDRFRLVGEPTSRILKVWEVASNQVAVCLRLEDKLAPRVGSDAGAGREIAVATTHLKARQGALLSTLRNEQGKDLLGWLEKTAEGRPVLLTGDFNAEPSEPVYSTITEGSAARMTSAYPHTNPDDTEDFTTWKIRETGEQKYVLDYIFHSDGLVPEAVLRMPSEADIGPARLPSLRFPSDHLSLVADFAYSPSSQTRA